MTERYDEQYWERLWTRTLTEHPDKVELRRPSVHLVEACTPLPPGRALDAGCGHGVEALWLAAHGWRVTAVDFAASAIQKGRMMAEALDERAESIDWICGDLESGTAQGPFDLVVCLYIHAPHGVEALVEAMAAAVDAGGTLLMAGHRPIDPATGEPTAAAGQSQVCIEAARHVLDEKQDGERWEWVVAEERPRRSGGVDAVIQVRRLS